MPETRPERVDVCIATYKRPEGLRRLLQSVVTQETDGRFEVAVNVADNDAAGSAEAVVREFETSGRIIAYGIEPTQSVSLARNRSISLGTGQYVATIDDDLYATPRWLVTLYDTLVSQQAGAVLGRVVHDFAPGTPQYVRDFFRRPDPPTGSTEGFVFATGNTLIRRALMEGDDGPFDPRFGRTGAEDSHFFHRLRAAGAKIVWCSEAHVVDEVPAERRTLRWILRRRFRHGYTAADSIPLPFTVMEALRYLRAIAKLAVIVALRAVAGTVHRASREKVVPRSVLMLIHGAYLSGRIARQLNVRFEEYKPR